MKNTTRFKITRKVGGFFHILYRYFKPKRPDLPEILHESEVKGNIFHPIKRAVKNNFDDEQFFEEKK